jgi:hypothetical protein
VQQEKKACGTQKQKKSPAPKQNQKPNRELEIFFFFVTTYFFFAAVPIALVRRRKPRLC